MGFETKKYHFYVLFARNRTIAIFHQKYEKVLKTTQNIPKTVDNHQEQLGMGLGNQLYSF